VADLTLTHKPVPVPTPETQPFWDGTATGELRVQRCRDCARHYFYPRPICPYCSGTRVDWVATSGRASLYSYVINHRPAPGWADEAPYVIAVVELDEGVRMMTNLVGVPPEPGHLPLDLPLRVVFRQRGEVWLPLFEPDPTRPLDGGGRAAGPQPPAPREHAVGPARSGEDVVIVGAAESDAVGTLPHHSALALHLEAALNALRDAGLRPADVDGVATVGTPGPVQVAHSLGITPSWLDSTTVGGSSPLFHVRHAAAAIRAGLATTVLVTHGESGRSRIGMARPPIGADSVPGQFERPFGITGPTTTFTLTALRYMKETGLTHEQLASVAVAQRRWSSRNPRARMRELITVDDVLASPLVAYPFHLLECCLVTDGGGALILTSRSRAAGGSRRPPVHLLGSGEAAESPIISQMPDFTTAQAFRRSSRAAFAEAGIGHDDVDHLMVYDAFAHVPLYGLEDIGFVKRGEAGAFVAEGHTSPGGRLPMNTNGGGLSYTHTGMYGMFAIQESVRQLRGEAAAQVPGVEVGVVLGNGGMFASAATLVLSNRLP
jgi:acetyl-CoA acetyltransferase/uncharacterized OB-fold protein